MNPTQQAHHEEQTEAARAQFQELWIEQLKPALFQVGVDQRANDQDFAFIEHIAWLAFREGQGK